MKAKIAIVGGGFSAGFARIACIDFGISSDRITIYADRILPPPEGAFYIHSIPGSLEKMDQFSISIKSVGTKVGYLQKQWGVVSSHWTSSFPTSQTCDRGYAPKYVHEQLWKGVEFTMLKSYLDDHELADLRYESDYDFVFHSFPTAVSTLTQESYLVKFMIADYPNTSGVAKDLEELEVLFPSVGHIILYNGVHNYPWVRLSRLFGKTYLEYPSAYSRFAGASPVKFYSDLHPDTPVWTYRGDPSVIPIGRLATWDRKKLSHHVYKDVQKVLEEEW